MNQNVVVDSSVFIEYLRGTSDDLLSVLIINNQVLLSQVVKLELLAGVRVKEISLLEKLFNSLKNIDSFAPTKTCERILLKAKGSGLLGGLADIMILADVISQKSSLLTYDKNMIKLAKKLKVDVIEG